MKLIFFGIMAGASRRRSGTTATAELVERQVAGGKLPESTPVSPKFFEDIAIAREEMVPQ